MLQQLRMLLHASTDGESILRLTVEAGGCSGFSYKFDLERGPRQDDRHASPCACGLYPRSTQFLLLLSSWYCMFPESLAIACMGQHVGLCNCKPCQGSVQSLLFFVPIWCCVLG